MFWAPYILLIFIGLFCKSSKAYDFTVIIFMGVLAWLNTTAADYTFVYLPTYLHPFDAYDMDLGWSFICYFGSMIGLYYNGFAAIVTVIAMMLFRWFGKRLGANTSFMLALFLIYPGLISLVQFRQFVASAVGCAGLAYLWTFKGERRYVIAGALLVAAFLLHRTALVLVLALLPSVLARTGKRGRVIAVLGLTAIACVLLVNSEVIAGQLFGDTKTDIYLGAAGDSRGVTFSGGLKNMALLFLMAAIPYLCCRYMAMVNGTLKDGLFDWGVGKPALGIFFLNLALIALVPVVFITNDFMRFERYGITLALALFSMMPELSKRARFLSCKATYVAIGLLFAYFYVVVLSETVCTPLLNPVKIPPFFAW